MSSDSMSMVTGVMQQSGLTMSPPTVDGMQLLSEEERFQERRRDILVLVMRFLVDYGFLSAYQTLCTEAATSLDQVSMIQAAYSSPLSVCTLPMFSM